MITLPRRHHAASILTSSSYRFDHPRLADLMNDMRFTARDLEPGDRVEPLDLPTTEGGRVRLGDPADPRPLFLIFGTQTCPMTASAVDGLVQLHERFGDRIRFVMVQVREAHPGRSIGQPSAFDRKMLHALRLKHVFRIPFDVAVDDVNGTVHQRFGSRPNSAYLLEPGGRIRLRVQWANTTEAIAAALAAVTAGQPPPRSSISRTPQAILRAAGFMAPVLADAGAGAVRDTWRVAPPMAILMWLATLFPFLPPARRGLPAAMLGLVLLGLGVAAIVRLLP